MRKNDIYILVFLVSVLVVAGCLSIPEPSECSTGIMCPPGMYCVPNQRVCSVSEVCGNGLVEAAAGEECDHAGYSETCNANCTLASCGDGFINFVAGEQCDPPVPEICSESCQIPQCGNGIVAPGEECDDAGNSMTCNAHCTFVSCGDGFRNSVAGEQCDPPVPEICSESCQLLERRPHRLVTGFHHTCALLETGSVHCWGDGADGQLGYGDTFDIGDDESPVLAADVGGSVIQLAAGGHHTCALLDTGAVRCWGRGDVGQLGYGNMNNIGDDETPAWAGDVEVGGFVIQIAAGYNHTCALLDIGAVRCWGRGDYGRLGYADADFFGNASNIGDNETPAWAGDVDVGGFVIQVAAGGRHTCALLATGSVRCWGDGADGRLGYVRLSNTLQ